MAASKPIDYKRCLQNLEDIINAMEYDCMRSGGKVKFNSTDLVNLYELKELWEKKLPKPAVKKAVNKEV